MRITNGKFPTNGIDGKPNGEVILLWSEADHYLSPQQRPKQAYVTTVNPGTVKGPHIHRNKWSLLTCLKGNVKIVTRCPQGGYSVYHTGDHYDHASIQIPAGTAMAIVSIDPEISYVLNLPSDVFDPSDNVTVLDFDPEMLKCVP